jgi:hypothetical protein
MSLTINRRYRDALYDGLMTDFTAIGDIFSHLHNNEPAHARRLHRRFAAELHLLDDLCWEQEPDVDEFELTMPARELRPIIERVYWSAVASLNNEPGELIDEAVEHLSNTTVACPEILARLADDLIAPVQGVGCADAPTTAAT